MSENNLKIQRNLWEKPWGYVESFLIGFGLIITGFFLETFSTSSSTLKLVYPFNLLFLGAYITVLFVLYKWFSENILVRWLTKVPASISSIVLVTFMVMIMGIIPQVTSENNLINNLGLNRITSNWAFLLILFQFLTCLGLVTIKRIVQFNSSNIGFILNHLGLFTAILAGVLGSGDMQRLSIDTFEGKPSWIATDNQKNSIELPFAFYLKDFVIDEYNPKLALIDNNTGGITDNKGNNLYLVGKGEKYIFNNYEVEIETYFPNSVKFGDRYVVVNEMGSPPSAFLNVKNVKDDSIVSGWVSSGSFTQSYEALKLNNDFSVVMTIPEIKKFSSEVDILTLEGERISTVLEVNKPFSYGGYKIYQLSYNEKMGKWSDLSVLELVRDPWLPVVYFGIFMMIAGAIHMFWMGSRITKTN